MAQLVMVEGLPGSGKTTASGFINGWLADRHVPVHHFPEGRTDHPVDLEQVAVLTSQQLERLRSDLPDEADALTAAAERVDDLWLVRDRERPGWSDRLRDRLRELDSYDGAVTHDVHTRVLLHSWQRFAEHRARETGVFLFECVLIQNPMCALLARFDRPEAAVEAHIRRLADLTAGMDPLLVYLDAGDPATVLEAAAAERPAEWLELVIGYHTEQGYGLARGLRGFDGLVEFMRHRREVELDLLPRLPVTTFTSDVSDGDWDRHRAALAGFLEGHVDPRELALAAPALTSCAGQRTSTW